MKKLLIKSRIGKDTSSNQERDRKKSVKLKMKFKDPFGNVLLLKRVLTSILGMATYRRLNIANKMEVKGAEHLLDLPKTNVLFVSNHQTYFADVIALYHVFSSAKWGFKNINLPLYLLMPRVNSYYIAAEETMKSGFLPKLFSYAGAVTVKRSWRAAGQEVKRNSDLRAPAKIKMALDSGWVINFPQGTTDADAPVRKGSAHLIQALKPLVVPVQIDGFRKAFDKKGLHFRNKGTQLSVTFLEPVQFDDKVTIPEIQEFLEKSILL